MGRLREGGREGPDLKEKERPGFRGRRQSCKKIKPANSLIASKKELNIQFEYMNMC